jgi:glycosyltransferase involved in cell wall biosynthesis
MSIGIFSFINERKKPGVDNYIYNIIENLIKIEKADEISLINYQKSDDPLYLHLNDIIIPKIPLKLSYPINIPTPVKEVNIKILHVPVHWYSPDSLFFLDKEVKKVLTIHDLTPLMFPDMFTKDTAVNFKKSLEYIKNRTDIIISVSENTKKDIIRLLKIPEQRIKVIPIAADERYRVLENKDLIRDELKNRYNINYPFILSVGTLEKRKNIPLLIKAFHMLNKSKINHKLVIVGGEAWKKYTEINDLIQDLTYKMMLSFQAMYLMKILLNYTIQQIYLCIHLYTKVLVYHHLKPCPADVL